MKHFLIALVCFIWIFVFGYSVEHIGNKDLKLIWSLGSWLIIVYAIINGYRAIMKDL